MIPEGNLRLTICFLVTKGLPTNQNIEMSETLVPLNDDSSIKKVIKRGNSFGSENGVDIHIQGEENTLEYRVHAKDSYEGKTISLWHDINLVHIDPTSGNETEYYNFVCEIPKFSRYVTDNWS